MQRIDLPIGAQYKVAVEVAKKCNEFLDKADFVYREFCKEVSNRVIDRTPVDTGRCKANNQVNIGEALPQALNEYDKEGTSTKVRNNATLNNVTTEDKVTIYNNLTYAPELEYGKSTQAPSGFYGPTADEAKQILDEILIRVAK